MNHFVYFIGCGKNYQYIKIGVSNSPNKRLLELQTANPLKLTLIHFEPMNSERHAYHVEARLHKRFDSLRIRGEWFLNLPVKKAIEICQARRDKFSRSMDRIQECNDRVLLESLPVTMQ